MNGRNEAARVAARAPYLLILVVSAEEAAASLATDCRDGAAPCATPTSTRRTVCLNDVQVGAEAFEAQNTGLDMHYRSYCSEEVGELPHGHIVSCGHCCSFEKTTREDVLRID